MESRRGLGVSLAECTMLQRDGDGIEVPVVYKSKLSFFEVRYLQGSTRLGPAAVRHAMQALGAFVSP